MVEGGRWKGRVRAGVEVDLISSAISADAILAQSCGGRAATSNGIQIDVSQLILFKLCRHKNCNKVAILPGNFAAGFLGLQLPVKQGFGVTGIGRWPARIELRGRNAAVCVFGNMEMAAAALPPRGFTQLCFLMHYDHALVAINVHNVISREYSLTNTLVGSFCTATNNNFMIFS